jgi:hypothetical protein
MDSVASAVKQSSFIVFLRRVLIHFSDEKHHLDSGVVIGIVTIILSRVVISLKVSSRLLQQMS